MYFEKPGAENTKNTIDLAVKTAKERGIKYIVFASTSGYTADFIPADESIHFICVTHSYGTKLPNENRMDPSKFEEIKSRGINTCTSPHVFSGAARAIANKFDTVDTVELLGATLKLFCQGMKVVVEISCMAADAGMIPVGEPIIAVAGTGHGADTAVILRAANASHLFDLKIDEIICKPIA